MRGLTHLGAIRLRVHVTGLDDSWTTLCSNDSVTSWTDRSSARAWYYSDSPSLGRD